VADELAFETPREALVKQDAHIRSGARTGLLEAAVA
jgi:hypothetical protein